MGGGGSVRLTTLPALLSFVLSSMLSLGPPRNARKLIIKISYKQDPDAEEKKQELELKTRKEDEKCARLDSPSVSEVDSGRPERRVR